MWRDTANVHFVLSRYSHMMFNDGRSQALAITIGFLFFSCCMARAQSGTPNPCLSGDDLKDLARLESQERTKIARDRRALAACEKRNNITTVTECAPSESSASNAGNTTCPPSTPTTAPSACSTQYAALQTDLGRLQYLKYLKSKHDPECRAYCEQERRCVRKILPQPRS